MPRHVTFIHTADLHIGAPFRGLRAVSPKWAKRLREAITESYDRVIDAALESQVDFVIIAGDIFDSARASYADYLRFFNGLKRLNDAGIHAYLCAGNHDPYTSWKQDFFAFPERTKMFSADRPSFEVFERDGAPLALLGGRGYYNQTWPADKDIAEGITRQAAMNGTGCEQAPFAIGVIHTGLNLDPTKAPTDPAALLASGMDYWALGHIHIHYVYPGTNPKMAFSGCVQGRDINETGERGAYKVTLTEGAPIKLEFIPTASVVWQKMRIDVSECSSIADISDKIMRELFRENGKSHCEEMGARITLTGKTPLHRVLDAPGVIEDLRKAINDGYPFFFCDALLDETAPPLDKDALRKEELFPSVLLRVSSAQRAGEEEMLAYLQKEFLARKLTLPKAIEDRATTLSEEAEDLVLDLLNRGDGR